MLYRIERIEENGAKSYEYVFGKRALGKCCYEIIAHDNMEISNIVKIVPTIKAFKICLLHTISDKKNQTTR